MSTVLDFTSIKNRFLWSIFLAAIFVNIHYYKLGTGNQLEQLPLVYRALNPHYLANDWFLNTTSGVNHRTVFTLLIASLARLVGVDNSFLILNYVGIWLLVWAFFEICRVAWEKPLTAPYQALHFLLSAGFGLLIAWGTLGIGGGAINPLEAAQFGIPLALIGTTYLLQKRFLAAGIIYFVAGLIHPLAAPQILFLSLATWWFQQSRSEKRDRWFPALGLLLVASFPLLLLRAFFTSSDVTPEQMRRATEILIFKRAPHHYAPFTWPLSSWLEFGASLSFIALLRTQTDRSPFLYGLAIATAIFALAGCLPFLSEKTLALAKLQPFRMTLLIPMLISMTFGRYLGQLASTSKANYALALALGTALLLNRFTIFAPRPNGNFLMTPAVWTLAFAGYLTLRHFLPRAPQIFHWIILCPWWIAFLPVNVRVPLKPYLVIVALMVLVYFLIRAKWTSIKALGLTVPGKMQRTALFAASVCFLGLYATKIHAISPDKLDFPQERPLYNWVRLNTPRDAVFLTPPTLSRFRIAAERAMVVDYKLLPFRDVLTLEWQDRVQSIDAALDAESPDPKPWRRLAKRFGAGYLVLPSSSPIQLQPIYKDAFYAVYSLDS